jgi:predicted nucleic acid-binding protein
LSAPPAYLLDTNVVSEFGRARPNPELMAWLETVDTGDLGIPLNVLCEIQRGVVRIGRIDPCRASEIGRWFDGILGSAETNVVRPDRATALLFAEMAETPALREFFTPKPKGKVQLGDDPAIAALAISVDATVVTFDTDDFLRIHAHFPLPGLYHPGRAEWVVDPSQSEEHRP